MEEHELEELRALLRSILSNQERQMSDELKKVKNGLADLHDWKIKKDEQDRARAGVTQWLMRYWPGILAMLLAAFELKKMTP